MNLDLTDEEADELTRHLREAIDYARYPLAPRLDPLKAILVKLDPPAAVTTKPPQTPKPGDRPRAALAAMKRRRGGG